jgi:hypothetical protein
VYIYIYIYIYNFLKIHVIYLNWNFQKYYEDKKTVFSVLKFMIISAFALCVQNYKAQWLMYIPPVLTLHIFQYSAIFGFRVVSRINSHEFPIQY